MRYPPTAVAANDLVAIGVISTLKRHGQRVPSDTSGVGIDDIQMASLLDPPLTTVAQPIYKWASREWKTFSSHSESAVGTSEIMFETRLTIRQSTAKRPVKKTLISRTR
ncbi:MAG: substrate-binding domain-containing protein [Verrucomicrobia bacterium]|nr:substrate-binding domain-containing protein [Verrucomicrobiota bacterium]